jgi:hypothetical protein
MQTCKNCQSTLPDNVHICPFCGNPIQKENNDARRNLLMWLRLGNIPAPLTVTASVTPYLVASTLILGFVIVGLFLRPPTPNTLIVTPFTLDFGKLVVGQKAVKSVVIETSSVSNLTWKIVSGNPQWLNITQSNVIKEPDNLSEVVYDVTANIGNLHEGKYSVTYTIDVGGVKDQQVQINFQVIPPSRQQLPARLSVDPLTLDFGTQNVGSQMTKLLTVSNSGQMDLNWMADRGNATWLTLDLSQGKIAPGGLPQVIKVLVNTTPLTVSPYTALITFTSNGGTASVDVKLSVVVTPTTYGPEVMSVSPNKGPIAGDTNVTISGSGFTNATAVSFGTVSVANNNFMVNSDTQITAVSPAPAVAGVCAVPCYIVNVDVTVTTPIGTSNINGNDKFTYIPLPIVSGITSNCGPNAGGTSVMIMGAGFTGATGVSFGTVSVANNNFMVNSDTQITTVSPAGSGIVDVTIITPGGTSATSRADRFAYIPHTVVSNISPASGPANGGTTVTITGSGFTSATSVLFGSTTTSNFTVVSDTQISVASPAGSSGTVDVIVTSCGGTSITSNADQFTYTPLPVTVKITSPADGSSFGTSPPLSGHTGPITFTASASDSSGHPLTGTALQWTVDGNSLGTGESFSATLPSGCGVARYTVKVVATDSASGLNASDTITVSTGTVC